MKKTLLAIVVACAAFIAPAQYPVPTWTVPLPDTVSGVAVDNLTGFIATSCFDGVTRSFDQNGQLLAAANVGGARNCVAFRDGKIVTGRTNDFAIAISPNGDTFYPDFVPTTYTVRGISQTAKFAVAQDNAVYNLTTGARWWTGTFNQFAWPMSCVEDGTDVWTVDLDGGIRKWAPDGTLLLRRDLGVPLWCIDVNATRVVIVTDNGLVVLDKATGNTVTSTAETVQIRQAKFLPDGSIVYSTAGGPAARLVRWDGVRVSPPTVSPKPPKVKGPKSR